jgi:hypothetical protein
LGLLLASACGAAEVADVHAFSPHLMDLAPEVAWVEGELQEAVAHTRWLRPTADAETPELPLRLAVVEARGADGEALLRIEAEGEFPAEYRTRFGRTLDAVVEVESTSGAIDPQTHGAMAVDRAIAVLDAKLGLVLEGEAALEGVLSAPDAQIVILGLDWIAAHRVRARADEVARLVDHEQPLVALRAIECLALVGGPEHVHALVRRPHLADRAYARRIYDAVAQLGGPQALGFLDFAARNEDDPEMADAAAQALARVGQARGASEPLTRPGRGHR